MKKLVFAFVFLLLLISGCTTFQQPPQQAKADYEIFSNVPTDNISSLIFIKFNEDGAKEISSFLGTMLGGTAIKKLKDGQIGFITYKDYSTAIVAYLRTNMSIDEALESIPYMESSGLIKETKKIGEKEVTLVYQKYDEGKDNPLCLWKEGEMLKVLSFSSPYPSGEMTPVQCTFPPGFTCISWKLNANGSIYLKIGQGLGKTINITGFNCTQNINAITQGGTIQFDDMKKSFSLPSASEIAIADPSNSTRYITCTDETGKTITGAVGTTYNGKLYINYTEVETGLTRIAVGSLSTKYEGYQDYGGYKKPETKGCDKLMEKTYETKNIEVLLNESEIMEGKASFDGKFLGEGRAYRPNAYGVAFSDDDGIYILYITHRNESESSICYGESSEIAKEGEKNACRTESSGFIGSPGFISFERRVGSYSAIVLTFVKGSKNSAVEKAKKVVFSLPLEGKEEQWSNEVRIDVKVKDDNWNKVSEAKVELYFDDELRESKYTDSNGVASLGNISLNSISKYSIKVTREGYKDATHYLYYWEAISNEVDITLEPAAVPKKYTESSDSTNVTINEASLSNFPIINSNGQPVVKVVVGEKGSGRDVKAAGNIAAMIGNRAYKKVVITATMSNDRCIPSVSTATLPYLLNTSKSKLVILDDEVTGGPDGIVNQNLIAVGNDKNNVIISDVLKAAGMDLQSEAVIVRAIGTNRIIVAGYTDSDTMTAANKFITDIVTALEGFEGGGSLTYSNTLIINSLGKPQVNIVVGAASVGEESVGAANIAAMIGNRACKEQVVTATYSGGACVLSLNNSIVVSPINTATLPLVVLDKNVDETSSLLVIGNPSVNSVADELLRVAGLSVSKGNAIVRAVGTNRIVIAGGTEMDTERAADKFIEWFAKKYN